MAVFLSKRILRYTMLAGLCVTIIVLLSSDHVSSTDINYLEQFKGLGTGVTDYFRGSETPQLSEKEKEVEEERQKVEKNLAQQHEDGKVEFDEPAMDKNAQALKESAEEADAAHEPQTFKSTWEFMAPSYANKGKKPKAAFVVLVRNNELEDILPSIKNVEDKFNHQFNYPWVFFNDEEFTEEFKTKINKTISSKAEFGLIPKEHWSYPDFVNQETAKKERDRMVKDAVIYGGSESYRHMCRFQSGFFWRQKLLEDYDWYWRVEPSTRLYCDIKYDVFQYMQDEGKVYGFTITIHEYLRTIETLWKSTRDFWKKNPHYIADDNLVEFISGDKGKTYNLCHFWSNFEIANLNFWRSPAYREYFDYLDRTGNFFYERWGDAPVHSIAASLFLSKDKIHYFSDIGYHHNPYDNCPLNNTIYKENNCDCDQGNDFTFQGYACGVQYYDAQGLKKPDNWEKFQQ